MVDEFSLVLQRGEKSRRGLSIWKIWRQITLDVFVPTFSDAIKRFGVASFGGNDCFQPWVVDYMILYVANLF
jgi:hypothetical protein